MISVTGLSDTFGEPPILAVDAYKMEGSKYIQRLVAKQKNHLVRYLGEADHQIFIPNQAKVAVLGFFLGSL